MNALRLICGVLGSLILCACAQQKDTTLPKGVTNAFETAASKSDVEGCAVLFRDDAEIVAEDSPAVRGKDAIREFCRTQFARELLIDTEVTVSIVSGDVAMDQGIYRIRNVEKGLDIEHGDYLSVWRKTDGQWRIFRTFYNVTVGSKSQMSIERATPFS